MVVHLLLAAATLIATGELPDWGWYLNTLREFLFGQIGDLTYDFSPWSPALAVGALYLVSASALSLLMWRRPEVVARQRTMLIAIAAMTAFGIALFTYIVNRSADHIVPYVCLPAVTLGALWITLLERPVLAVPAAGRRAAWALGLAVSALLDRRLRLVGRHPLPRVGARLREARRRLAWPTRSTASGTRRRSGPRRSRASSCWRPTCRARTAARC